MSLFLGFPSPILRIHHDDCIIPLLTVLDNITSQTIKSYFLWVALQKAFKWNHGKRKEIKILKLKQIINMFIIHI